MRYQFIYILTFAIFLLPSSLQANDSFVSINGFNAYPINTDKVRMVSEKITVTMGEKYADVVCDFYFENTSNVAIIANVGFPTGITDTVFGRGGWSLRDFTAYIEGNMVPVSSKREVVEEWINDEAYGIPPSKEMKYRDWYTWKTEFPPKRRIHIRNEYSTRYSGDSIGNAQFDYILTTGANWHGTIGETVIELKGKNGKDIGMFVLSAPGFEKDGEKLTWIKRDFIPASDIRVQLRNFHRCRKGNYPYRATVSEFMGAKEYYGDLQQYDKNEVGKMPLPFLKYYKATIDECSGNFYPSSSYFADLKSLYLRVLRNEIFARKGREFNSQDLLEIFRETTWYKPNPNFSASMLNDTEKKNIQMILDYEKELGYR